MKKMLIMAAAAGALTLGLATSGANAAAFGAPALSNATVATESVVEPARYRGRRVCTSRWFKGRRVTRCRWVQRRGHRRGGKPGLTIRIR